MEKFKVEVSETIPQRLPLKIFSFKRIKNIKKIEKEEEKRILSGGVYTLPGATEAARRERFYCSQPTVRCCADCSFVNYNRDCHNNPVEPGVTDSMPIRGRIL